MSANLIEMAKGLFTNEVTSRAASAFGESESGVSKAISALVPTIFSGLADKAHTPGGADIIANLASDNSHTGLFDNLGSLLGGSDNSSWLSRGSGLVSSIFGNKVDGIVNLLSNFAGIKSSSSSSLLSLAVPAILGFLGKYMRTNNVNASGLSSLLGSQKSFISSALPAGLSLGSLFSGYNEPHTKTTTHSATTTTSYNDDNNGGGGIGKWLLPLLLLAAIAAGALYFFNGGCNKKDATHGTDSTTVTTNTSNTPVDTTNTSTTTTTTTTTRTLTKVALPNGTQLDAYPGGIEDQLIKFIGSDEYKNATNDQLKDHWFNFDDLNFEMGKATKLTDESKRQLDNIIAILKAFPDVKIKIGGYTDKKGDDAANLKLSSDRAKFVQAALKAAGVGAQVPEAEGYGEKFATVDENASDEARLVDRKTSIRLIK